jgi:hypothetical protein
MQQTDLSPPEPDAVVAPAPSQVVPFAALAAPAPAPRRAGWQGEGLGLAAIVGLAALGAMLWPPRSAPQAHVPVSVAAFGRTADAPAAPAEPAAAMPALIVLDAVQAARFSGGLERFTSAELAAYAAATRQDLTRRGQLLAAELTDALTLIEAEMRRRNGAMEG